MIFWRFNFQSYLNIYDICRGVYTILLNMRRIDTKWDWFFAYDVPNDVIYRGVYTIFIEYEKNWY